MTISNHEHKIPDRLKINLFTPAPWGVNWFWLLRARLQAGLSSSIQNERSDHNCNLKYS